MNVECVGLGKIAELVYRNDRGQVKRIRPARGPWLAWHNPTDQLLVIYKAKASSNPHISQEGYDAHIDFHGAPPEAMVDAQWQAPTRRVNLLGLCLAVTYVVPSTWYSPAKAGREWEHFFGDIGEEGHGASEWADYPDHYLPHLIEDGRRHLHLLRRPSNVYRVSDFIWS